MAMHAEAHKPGHRTRWGLRIMTAVSALVLAASGVGHAMVHGLNADMHRIDPFHGLTDRPRDTGGMNFLVVGIDKREGLSAEKRRKYNLGGSACDCTDTMMLVHLSADHHRVSVVSLPRDSYTKLPARKAGGASADSPSASADPSTQDAANGSGSHSARDQGDGAGGRTEPAKLNSAYARGGAPLTVNTVEAMTNVHIDHYLEVDFNSFMKTVDVLGGVPVCTEKPLQDSYSGLDLPAGTTRLNGGQALQYVRARHLDDGSDLSRIRRQQRFLASVIHKATASGVLMNPVKFDKVASTVIDSVRADRGFGSDEMLDLGRAMKGFKASSSEFASVPIADPDHRVPGLGSTVKWDETKARKLFGALRDDHPLTEPTGGHGGSGSGSGGRKDDGRSGGSVPVDIPPASVRVQVDNGTKQAGLGRKIDQALRATGFAASGSPRNSTGGARETTIGYDPRWDRSARSLAKALPGARLVSKKGQGPVMRVTLGARHGPVRHVHVEQTATPAGAPASPGGGPGSDGAVRGDDVKCS